MNFEAFWEAYRQAREARLYDTWMISDSGPRPTTEAVTEETLRELTDQVIRYEEMVASAAAEYQMLDRLSSELNLHYDAGYAAENQEPSGVVPLGPDAPQNIRYAYEQATQHLEDVRRSLDGHLQIVQALLATYIDARGKVEHDLGWQAYVRDTFGVDPSQIPREEKRLLIEPRLAA